MKCNKCGNELTRWDNECEICGTTVFKESSSIFFDSILIWIKANPDFTVLIVLIVYTIVTGDWW